MIFFSLWGDDGTLGKRSDLGKFTASLRSGSHFTCCHLLSSSVLLRSRTPQPARFVPDGDSRPSSGGREGQGRGASAEDLGAASGLGGRRHMLKDSQRGPSLVLRRVHSCDDVDPLVAAQPCDLMALQDPTSQPCCVGDEVSVRELWGHVQPRLLSLVDNSRRGLPFFWLKVFKPVSETVREVDSLPSHRH